MTLTNTELAETATVLLAQVDRADLRIVYAGNGWFHRRILYMPGRPFKERRAAIERTIAALHARIKREAEERPKKERLAREAAARERLIKAAPDLLRFLRDAVAEITQRDDPADEAWLEEAQALLKHVDPEGV